MGLDRWQRRSRHITRGPRWAALRLRALRRDKWACVKCGARGRLEIDHIEPVRTHPERAWALDNLQSLCPACHTRKTKIDIGHDRQNEGRSDWQKAVAQLAK
jgi:5-methylcytosine-specific restriction enzyme A